MTAPFHDGVRETKRRLILDAAVGKKLEMQEWLVDNRVREIVKDNFGGDMNKLNAQLAQSKVALTDWRNQIRDDMIVVPIRSGVGARLGVNLGYLKFTPQATWNPF